MFLLVIAVAAAVAIPAAPAFAPHVAQLLADPVRVQPGDEVTVWGPAGFGATNPVEIRLGSPDAPVLGSFPTDGGFYAAFAAGTVTIPTDTEPGFYTLYATQELEPNEAHIRGLPARAVIQVVSGDAAGTSVGAPVVEGGDGIFPAGVRPESLAVEDSGPSLPLLIALAAGVAVAAALAGAGLGRLGAGRGRQVQTEQESR